MKEFLSTPVHSAIVAFAFLGWIAGLALPVSAHELGPFQVYGTFLRNGSFRLDIKVDEEHLTAGQAGGPARRTRYGVIAGMQRLTERHFGRFLSELADSLTLRFDGKVITPTLRMDPEPIDPAAPPRATMFVEGWTPGGAHTFTLQSSLPVKAYPLVLNSEGDESSVWKWVEQGKVSQPYPFSPQVVPPPAQRIAWGSFRKVFAAILPHDPARLLLVLALCLLARRVRPGLVLLAVFALGSAVAVLAAPAGGAWALRPSLAEALRTVAIAALGLASLLAPAWPWRSRAASALLLATTAAIGWLYGSTLVAWLPAAAALPPALRIATAIGGALGSLAADLFIFGVTAALIALPWQSRPWYRRRVVIPASGLLAIVGVYWFVAGFSG